MKNRKAFNFYRSYYDLAVELPDEQKLQFLMAILNKQFLDIDPQIDGIVGLLYKSQKHSIDAQVNGYKNKKGIATDTPSVPPCQPPTEANKQNTNSTCQPPSVPPYQPPSVQEKGEEKEKEQVEGEEQGVNDKVQKKYELKNKLKTIFKSVPNIDKLIDRNDMDVIERSDKHLFNIHYQTILEYQSIKL